MLIQSQDGAIHLLPALPSNWKSGEFKGLKARGGFEIDVKWEDYKIKQIKIKSTLGGNCRIRSYESLNMKGAKSVNSSIHNANAFFQVLNVPQPIISTKANLKGTILKNIFEFDLPTKAGESYNFIF
jgi:alpha-L-fucosidase 2